MKSRSIVVALGVAAGMAAAPAMAVDDVVSLGPREDVVALEPGETVALELGEAADTLVQFEGGIGVIPVSSGVGQGAQAEVVNRNIVRGVQPAGQIWVIRILKATVKTGGAIRVAGKGLLLGGGNNIGGSNNANVFATLICEAAAPFTERNTNLAGVQLDPNGNFRIDDILNPVPVDCASPVFLIRNAANLGWFAAAIPKRPRLPEEQVPTSPQILMPFR